MKRKLQKCLTILGMIGLCIGLSGCGNVKILQQRVRFHWNVGSIFCTEVIREKPLSGVFWINKARSAIDQ